MEPKTDGGPALPTSEELAAIEDEEVLNKMVKQWSILPLCKKKSICDLIETKSMVCTKSPVCLECYRRL